LEINVFRKLVVFSIFVPATAAFAQVRTIQPPPGDASIVVEGKKQKRVCKKFPPMTGTRVGERRVCKSEVEWQAEEAVALRAMDRQNRVTDLNRAQDINDQNKMAAPLPR